MKVLNSIWGHLVSPSSSLANLVLTRASGCYVYDSSGRDYIDLISGISVSALGHGNTHVQEALVRQLASYSHVMVYGEWALPVQVAVARALVSTLPLKKDWGVYLTPSGSEAVEGALKLAVRTTARPQLVACCKGYHGSTLGALSLCSEAERTDAFRPLRPAVSFIRFGHRADLSLIHSQVAAVFIEPVQGEAGVRQASPSYFKALAKQCKKVGALLVADEIQCGWGRTGTFWAFESLHFVPDILLTAKAFGGGMPLGAFVAPQSIMKNLSHKPSLGHITTFGGHPMSCAASLASWKIIYQSKLFHQVPKQEKWWRQHLKHPFIKEVRSAGLLMAVELEDTKRVQAVLTAAQQNGLLLDSFLHCPTAIRLAPPLTMTQNECQIALQRLKRTLDAAQQNTEMEKK